MPVLQQTHAMLNESEYCLPDTCMHVRSLLTPHVAHIRMLQVSPSLVLEP